MRTGVFQGVDLPVNVKYSNSALHLVWIDNLGRARWNFRDRTHHVSHVLVLLLGRVRAHARGGRNSRRQSRIELEGITRETTSAILRGPRRKHVARAYAVPI